MILTGGEGRRLGRRKETIEIAGETLLDRHLRRWGSLFPRVWVSKRPSAETLDDHQKSEARVILDPPDCNGIIEVISGILQTTTAPTMVIAVDLPLLPVTLVERLTELHCSGSSVIPMHNRGLEPLAAIYDPVAISGIEALISSGCRSLQKLPSVSSCLLPRWPEELLPWADGIDNPFFNVNTIDDLKQLEESP